MIVSSVAGGEGDLEALGLAGIVDERGTETGEADGAFVANAWIDEAVRTGIEQAACE